jgi:hypothetical protein
MKKHLLTLLLLSSSYLFSQSISFEDLEKNAGKYYTNIEASLLISRFELLTVDNNAKKLTYQYSPANNEESGNKYCYVWRSEEDKAETITYYTTSIKEYINWKKSLIIKNYKSKPVVQESDGTKEWFYSKNILVKILHKQLDSSEKNDKIDAYIITFIKKK